MYFDKETLTRIDINMCKSAILFQVKTPSLFLYLAIVIPCGIHPMFKRPNDMTICLKKIRRCLSRISVCKNEIIV